MLKRTISGAVYVALVTAFFLLRQLTPYPQLFHLFIWFMGAMGAFEVGRALKPYSAKYSLILAIIFGVTFSPVYFVAEYFIFSGWGWLIAIDYALLWLVGVGIYCICTKKDANGYLASALPFIYPALLILTMHITNDITGQKGFIAMLLLFVVSPLTDTMAYLVGSTFKGPKLCPKLSPKKTISGAVGGLIGGILSAVILWIIFNFTVGCSIPVWIMIIVGFFASVLTQAGDLVESFLKRKTGIKDMGKIMPGHGGVMDRIDGMIFASLLICIVFLLV